MLKRLEWLAFCALLFMVALTTAFTLPPRVQAAYAPLPQNESFWAQGSDLVPLNTAVAGELCSLPGIGEKRAQAILAYRARHGPFLALEDLTKVSGISKDTVEKLKHLVSMAVQ